jgi:hypothetical protein
VQTEDEVIPPESKNQLKRQLRKEIPKRWKPLTTHIIIRTSVQAYVLLSVQESVHTYSSTTHPLKSESQGIAETKPSISFSLLSRHTETLQYTTYILSETKRSMQLTNARSVKLTEPSSMRRHHSRIHTWGIKNCASKLCRRTVRRTTR